MSCYHPLYALDLGINAETGKKHIKILPKRVDINLQQLHDKFGRDCVLQLPCGHCIGCYLDHAKEWAARCVLEAKYHEKNCFLTLTYDDEHVPVRLQKDHFQKFIRALRDAGHSVRYFGCGEYGSKTLRPHYHIIIFGFMPSDLKKWSVTNAGMLYTSSFLEGLWNKGRILVAEVNFLTCGYVARYVMKKAGSPYKDEFVLMSKKPGIGTQYFYDHCDTILEYGKVHEKFGNMRSIAMPRYYEKLAERLGFDLSDKKQEGLARAADAVVNEMNIRNCEFEEQVYSVQEEIKRAKVKVLKRGL